MTERAAPSPEVTDAEAADTPADGIAGAPKAETAAASSVETTAEAKAGDAPSAAKEPAQGNESAAPPEPIAAAPPALAHDYEAVLRGVVDQVQRDPAQLRAMVYELARMKLRREALQSYPRLKRAEVEQQMAGLEAAIRRFEADEAEADDARSNNVALAEPAPPPSVDDESIVIPERPPRWVGRDVAVSLEPATDVPATDMPVPRERSRSVPAQTILQFAGAAAIGILAFAAITGQINLSRAPTTPPPLPAGPGAPPAPAAAVSADTPPAPAIAPAIAPAPASPAPAASAPPPPAPAADLPFPMPTAYGVYAVVDGKLVELSALPIKVPDPRIQMSAEFTTPSATTIPGDDLMFVAYRRELAASAPPRVPLRVVAQVLREMSFTGGSADVKQVEGPWHIRAMSVELRVAPVASNRELVTIQPEPGFRLSPGRYALVLNGTGYDFQVPGSPVSIAHCLERFEATSGPMVAECKTP